MEVINKLEEEARGQKEVIANQMKEYDSLEEQDRKLRVEIGEFNFEDLQAEGPKNEAVTTVAVQSMLEVLPRNLDDKESPDHVNNLHQHLLA